MSEWRAPMRLGEAARGPVVRTLEPDEQEMRALARTLDVDALEDLKAEVRVSPWLDGAELEGRWSAVVNQTCGVTLEPMSTRHGGSFLVRVVPPGSSNAPQEGPEVAVDPEAEDPPDVLEGEEIDLAGYVVEHLALEIDPFPRKPGAVFEAPEPESPPSPFAALAALKREGEKSHCIDSARM